MVAKKNEVAVQDTGSKALATNAIPDWMRQDAGKGTEAISAADIEIPRLKLLQAINPEIEQFDEAKVGHFWHSISEESLGSTVKVVILLVDQRFILWRPRWEGGGILARADDGVHWNPPNQDFDVQPVKGVKTKATWSTKRTVEESGLAEWGSSQPGDPNSQPAATKMYNLLVAFPERPDLGFGIVTLQRAGIKVARKLMGKLKITQAPSFGILFDMSSTEEEGQEGPYRNYSFRAAGFVEDQEQYLAFKSAHERFKAEGIQIKDIEGAQSEGDAAPAGGGAAPAGAPAY